VYGEFELEAGESITRRVEVKDIWTIDEEKLKLFKTQALEYYTQLKDTPLASQALILKNDVFLRINTILSRQKESEDNPQDHIIAYRQNQEELKIVEQDLSKLQELVLKNSDRSNFLASMTGGNIVLTWGIIITIIGGLGILYLFLYLTWKHQTMLVHQLLEKKEDSDATVVSSSSSSFENVFGEKEKTLLRFLRKTFHLLLYLVPMFVLFYFLKSKNIDYSLFFKRSDKIKKNSPQSIKNISPTIVQVKVATSESQVKNQLETKTIIIQETETGWLNIRSGPGVSFKIVSRALPEEEYEKLKETINEKGELWIKIKINNTEEGWVFAEYVREK